MAQHHDLGILRRLAAAQQKQPAKDPDQGEVQKSKRHRPRSFLITVGGPTRRSRMLLGVLERYTGHSKIRMKKAQCPEGPIVSGQVYRPTLATAYSACASVNPLPASDVSCWVRLEALNPPICIYPL